jgi:type IX secretion system PorP/SprF family membrane protein
MRKIAFSLILLSFAASKIWAGQDPLYTQFMTNPYLINPALTGTYNHYQIITNNRIQWIGQADAPITNTISMYGPMVNHPMGIGGYIMQDKFGPESKISINATYGYNYSISEDLKISLGLMVGMFQHKIDGSGLNIKDVDDPYFTEGQIYQNFKPDASMGAYLYSSLYHVGFSVTDLFGNKLQFSNDVTSEDTIARSTISRMKQHFYLHGGYKYFITPEFAIEPSVIFRKVGAVPLQMDINARAWYGKRSWNGNNVWGGLSYRTGDAINLMVGFIYQKKIEVGYSYDIGISKFRAYHSGSHELMVTFRFNDIKEY